MKSNNELNDLFDYDYRIYQNADYFKFSIDSVLLAEFVDLKKGHKKVLDMCSGNAPVPLILNKKYGNLLEIVGVEIQKEVYELGKLSIEYNKVENISFINKDIKDYVSSFNEKYDIVTCNPPYFKKSDDKIINDNEVKALARHEIAINLEEVVCCASKILKNKGYFYLVHRPERLADIINALKEYRFGLKRVQMVYDDYNSDCCFILVEAIYNGEDYVKIDYPIFLKDYTTYKDIFRR
ncbi:MAG: methyltransferase [Bacilli bacterium]|nr:methyltransferase [Bacilli bacterium]MDE6142390.1 methyltransferase [Bacilli bacterium]